MALYYKRWVIAGHQIQDTDSSALQSYLDWFSTAALPFWLDHAVDENGMFFEALDFEGSPLPDVDLRIRTAMRQVYVFAECYNTGETSDPRSLAIAIKLCDMLRDKAWAPDQKTGWIARFTRDGRVLNATRDFYDHTFALLGLGALLKATGDPKYQQWLDETFQMIDGFRNAAGGFDEDDKQTLPRRQNPHMHYFEACTCLFDWTGDEKYLKRADDAFQLFKTKLFDHKAGVLREHFGPNWEVSTKYGSGRIEPGHMAEWVWLLRSYGRFRTVDVDQYCSELLKSVNRIGISGRKFLYDEVDVSGQVLLKTSRLWPQTELIKAYVVQNELKLLQEANRFAKLMQDQYFSNVPLGTWRDQFSIDGQLTAKNIPASIFYHVFTIVPTIRRAII